MPRRILCAALLAALLIGGCGGSTHSSSASAPSSAASASATSTAASASASTAASASATSTAASSTSPGTTTSPATTTSTVSAGPSTTTATTSSRPPEVPKSKAPKRSNPTAPDTNVRIPAAFSIGSGGAITPALITLPAGVTIELRLRNRDSQPHTVALPVAHFSPLSIPAGGSKTTEVTGVRKGTYRLLIDGAAKAKIVVGAVPGP